MIQYIYFVKCPNCEDEHFDFFDEAKEFALSCLSNKPIITQTEVCRNDFGECTDSADLGTVWSWEDMMKEAEPEDTVFSKDETFGISEGLDDFDDFDIGPQIDEFDNSLDFDFEDDSTETLWVAENLNGGEIVAACWADSEDLAHRLLSQAFRERTGGDLKDCYIREAEADEPDYITDNPNLLAEACSERKPIPEGMTIEQLVEEMEENEDTVECTWCEELFDKSECRKEVNLGWLCSRCEAAIKSRGETLTFRENNYWDFLDEAATGKRVRLVHNSSKYHSDGEPYQLFDLKKLFKSSDIRDLDTGSINLIAKFDNNCKVIQETDKAYLVTVPCYYRNQQDRSKFEERPKYIRCWVPKIQTELINESISEDPNDVETLLDLGNEYDGGYPADNKLAELEEAADYRKHLDLCPECGGENAFDHETGFCLDCGFNL